MPQDELSETYDICKAHTTLSNLQKHIAYYNSVHSVITDRSVTTREGMWVGSIVRCYHTIVSIKARRNNISIFLL
jgi:hypothetical protein